MKIVEDQEYQFQCEVIEPSPMELHIQTLDGIDEGAYWFIAYSPIGFLFAAKAIIEKYKGDYLVKPYFEEEADPVLWWDLYKFAKQRLTMTFGLESLNGDIYAPEGVTT